MTSTLLKRPELLAPAGGWPQLDAAVRFGADAVYLACDKFGMRAAADNFSLAEAARAITFAHENSVKAYFTLNTLMNAPDLRELPAYFEALADAGADAFIISDMGAFSLAKRHAPNVALHVSTQASVMNSEAARAWHDLGASRVVCAREMSLADIADLCANVPAELEVEAFVHGAMCMAYSGRCLLSSAMTGRSGNRGACAQSCRWSYALVEEKRPGEFFPIDEDVRGSYIMNAEDLNMVSHLDELRDAGIDSFKVEGRNKQAFYVATVVGAYRSVLDGGDADAADRELRMISHRPYGTGFYFGRPNQTQNRDGYVRECILVAIVEDCEAAGEGRWRVTAICHNKFAPGDALGVLSPGADPRDVHVSSPVFWLAPADGGAPFVERSPMSLEEVRSQSVEQPADVISRTKERYVFMLDAPVKPGDFLRKALA